MKYCLSLLTIIVIFGSCKNITANKISAPITEKTTTLPFPDSLKDVPDTIVKNLAIQNKCRVTLKITTDSGATHYTGFDGRANQPITDFSSTIDIGSCTKMFTATAIFQLIEQGKLSLNDRLTTILPNDSIYKNLLVIKDKNYIDSVTLLNLLNHSSGIADYFVEGSEEKELALHADSNLRFTPYSLIAMAKKTNKPSFIPNTSFKYSNTNYQFLALIIEKISGLPWQQYVQQNILNPLGLKNTYFASLSYPRNRAAGHYHGKEIQMPASIAGAAGELISTLDDMDHFIREWNKGKLFTNPKTIESIKKDHYLPMVPNIIQYGMGCLTIYNQCHGHAGETFGFQSFMSVLKNNYSFSLGIDDAAVAVWNPAIILITALSK